MTKNIKMLLADGVEVNGKPGDNMNLAVVGPPGCGKTFSYMLSNILSDSECSMIVDDKKGMLYRMTEETLRNKGYKVRKIDFVSFSGSMKYNCFQYVKTEEDIMRLADCMIPSNGINADRYWEMSSKNLFRCLVEIARHEYGEGLNLRKFMTLFEMCGQAADEDLRTKEESKDDVERIIKKHRNKGYSYKAMEQYEKLKNISSRTWTCTLNSLRVELMKFCSQKLFQITRINTCDFVNIGKQKMALFVISSDTDTSMYPFIQLMYHDIVHSLIKFADTECWENGGRLPMHVRFFVDDFASGIRQQGFENIIANCRSRNISYMLGFQSISQLQALYGNNAMSILDCINYQIFYSSTNIDTNYHISKMMQRPIREIYQMNNETICLVERGKIARFCKRVQTLNLQEYMLACRKENNVSFDTDESTEEYQNFKKDPWLKITYPDEFVYDEIG